MMGLIIGSEFKISKLIQVAGFGLLAAGKNMLPLSFHIAEQNISCQKPVALFILTLYG
jgi:hypothetical protein